ncbi:MAG: hypothetical protein GF344_05485 [Chitinivibrionales bacterium]|nr:hypothetical protein [Chitinivibrionales bacterium]MBD3356423.1 hypothetical protein [Chitinivibrionales bacterium]
MANPENAYIVVGIHITDRVSHVPSVQSVLTEYGCNIKTRIGLHEVSDGFCSPNGLLLVEFVGSDELFRNFVSALKDIEGVEVQQMVFPM